MMKIEFRTQSISFGGVECAFHMRYLSIECAFEVADCTLFCLLYRYFFNPPFFSSIQQIRSLSFCCFIQWFLELTVWVQTIRQYLIVCEVNVSAFSVDGSFVLSSGKRFFIEKRFCFTSGVQRRGAVATINIVAQRICALGVPRCILLCLVLHIYRIP